MQKAQGSRGRPGNSRVRKEEKAGTVRAYGTLGFSVGSMSGQAVPLLGWGSAGGGAAGRVLVEEMKILSAEGAGFVGFALQ